MDESNTHTFIICFIRYVSFLVFLLDMRVGERLGFGMALALVNNVRIHVCFYNNNISKMDGYPRLILQFWRCFLL